MVIIIIVNFFSTISLKIVLPPTQKTSISILIVQHCHQMAQGCFFIRNARFLAKNDFFTVLKSFQANLRSLRSQK
jgi:hypothetical protein